MWLSPLLCALLAAGPVEAPREIRVLVGPVESKGGLPQDQADLLAFALSREVALRQGVKTVLLKEVEGTMQYQNLKQVVGCESASCAAEIAGALNADEIIFGTLNRVGKEVFLALSRVGAVDAAVLGRALVKVDETRLGAMIQSPVELVAQLYSGAAPAPTTMEKPAAPAPAAAPAAQPAPAQKEETAETTSEESGGGRGRWVARAAGGGLLALGAGAVLWAIALLGVNLGVLAWDFSRGGRFNQREVPLLAALGANGALLGAAVMGVLTVGLLVGGVVVLGVSMVMP